jgi:hypothetical protein
MARRVTLIWIVVLCGCALWMARNSTSRVELFANILLFCAFLAMSALGDLLHARYRDRFAVLRAGLDVACAGLVGTASYVLLFFRFGVATGLPLAAVVGCLDYALIQRSRKLSAYR